MMTYSESAQGVVITQVRAIKEVKNHGCDIVEFFEDMGVCETYKAEDVLGWLGY